VWDAREYAILPKFDGTPEDQLAAGALLPFACHTSPDDLCSGWVGHRDPFDLVALRLGVSTGRVHPSALRYRTRVPLWSSGAEAQAHGLRDLEAPSPAARAAIRKIVRLRGLSPDQPSDPA